MRSGSGRIGVGVDDGLPHFCVELALLGGAAALVVETTCRTYDKPSAWAAFDQRMLTPIFLRYCAVYPSSRTVRTSMVGLFEQYVSSPPGRRREPDRARSGATLRRTQGL
jgi:hypothetical protein